MAAVGFAYGSFGDIVESIKLVPKVIDSIRSGGRTSDQWSQTKEELRSLCNDLTYLTTLQTTSPLDQFVIDRLQEEGAHCLSTTLQFHAKIAASGGIFQRVWWATSEEKDLAAFRMQLGERRAALSEIIGLMNRDALAEDCVSITRQQQTISVALTDVRDRVDEVGVQVRAGNDRIRDSVGGVTQQLTNQQETFTVVLTDVRDRVDEVGVKVRLGNDRIQDGVGGVTQHLIDQQETFSGALIGVRDRVDEVGEQVRVGNTRIQDGVSGVAQQITALSQSQISEVKKKLEEWLQSPNMSNKQLETEELRHAGTGSWLLGGREFNKWLGGPGVLWIEGQSGTGKTVLSSTVIRKLFNDHHVGQGTAIAYFYFDFRDKQKRLVHIMLRSIVLQLSAQSPNPYRALDNKYMLSKGQALPSYQDLQHILEDLLRELWRTYIVLDALDECEDRELGKLVELISGFQRWTDSPLHLLFTSQPRTVFTDGFEGVTRISLQPEVTGKDIRLFVNSELRDNRNMKIWASRADDIIDRVVLKSNGMFRLAACLLVELSRCKRQNELEKTLENLPNDLFGIYDRFLEAIRPQDFVYVAGVLRWLVFANDRWFKCTLAEVADAVAFDFSNPAHYAYDPSVRTDNANAILEWLEGLVTVHWRGPKKRLVLAHASVQDYIMSKQFIFGFDLRSGPSHTFIAQSCIGYLLHFADHPLNSSTFPNYPMAAYVAQNWHHHLLCCDVPTILFTDALRLLENGSRQYLALLDLRQTDRWGRVKRGPPSLYMCSDGGYTEIVGLLLAKGADVNQQGGKYGNALLAASYRGHPEVVRLLLANGANVNAQGGRYGTALQAACGRGYEVIVRLLLEHGADVKVYGGFFGSALQAASWHGDIDVVRLLLEHGADVHARGGAFGNSLQAASAEGETKVVRLLLENRADVNAKGGFYGSALQAASRRGNEDTVRLLLEYGGDVNGHGGAYGCALHVASLEGEINVVRLLLEYGADVNARGGVFGNMLEVCGRLIPDVPFLPTHDDDDDDDEYDTTTTRTKNSDGQEAHCRLQ
ncbi:hypothetical protein B0H14DRAFT_3867996 [Mycena olivaceomarginata]|nr:hypothetical protein B0H14DRAFT_3867996 [Mycena olivaceomarginata]